MLPHLGCWATTDTVYMDSGLMASVTSSPLSNTFTPPGSQDHVDLGIRKKLGYG